MSASLEGQVALVTGASRGIGRETALALGRAGAAVAVGYASRRDAAADLVSEIESLGVRATAVPGDLAHPATAHLVVEQAQETLGALDIVVNNAGLTRDGLCVRLTDEAWDTVIAVDLSAAFRVCRAALRPMIKRRSGRIINVSSIAGLVGNAGQANYSAAKAGLIGLTKSLCREVGSRGITVNAVAPGFIETDMTSALSEEIRTAALGPIPLGRMGTAAEVAAAICFLASPGAAYITGHVMQVDGGLGA